MHQKEVRIFELGIERLQGGSFHAYKENDSLFIQRSSKGAIFEQPTTKMIQHPNWALFFNVMKQHTIWNLEKEYGADLVATLWWHINIETTDQKVVSCGINLFPDHKPIDSSPFYISLKEAMKQMTNITMPK
jgi:hypothetical protein